MTPLEAPWRSGKTERACKGWKERQKSTTADTVRTNVFSAGILHRWKMPFWNVEEQTQRPKELPQTGELAQERSMTMRRIALQASLALDHKRRWKRALHHAAKHYKGELHVGQPLWFWRRGATAAKKPTNAIWHPGVVISNTLTTVWTVYRGSRSQVCKNPRRGRFTTMTRRHTNTSRKHMRHLGERLTTWRATSRMKTSLDKMNLQ